MSSEIIINAKVELVEVQECSKTTGSTKFCKGMFDGRNTIICLHLNPPNKDDTHL